ncbi:MAG: branched-chain amino acid ABC transporter permease [Chloroflexota bacterium]
MQQIQRHIQYWATPVFIIVALAALIAAPQFLSPFQTFLLAEILTLAVFAQSFNLLFGYTGLLSLGQSAYFAAAALAVALLLREVGLGLPWLIVGGVIASVIFAALVGLLAVRVHGHGFIIITAVPTILFVLFGQDQSWLTGGDNGLNLIPPKLFGQWSFFDPTVSYYVVLPFFVATMFALRWLVHSPLGRAFQLIRENEERAAVLGYDVLRLKWISFTIAGGVAGLSGALFALVTAFVIPQQADWTMAAAAINWTLIGGSGTLLGPVVGTGVWLLLRESMSDVWSNGSPLLLGILLILIVRFAPRGIVGTINHWWQNQLHQKQSLKNQQRAT